MTDEIPATLGVLLAGGQARRMGGGDKPMRTIGGRSILGRAIERIAPQCTELILSANGDPARFAAYGLPIVADKIQGFAGPLAGLLATLDWTAANRPNIEWVLSVAGDCPFLPRDLVARLHDARCQQNADIAVAASGGQIHHVVALWHIELRQDLRHALAVEDIRQVSRWASRYKMAIAEWPTTPVDPFFNANTPSDLVEAERLTSLEN